MADRIVALVDMDCFYVQVEQRIKPEYKNKPCAVVQYNAWKGGGIIAVNYEARDHGVKRGMRGAEAKVKCSDIHLFQVPELRGKANLTRYRDAGAEVMDVLCEFGDCVERASIDEAYLDLTQAASKHLSVQKVTEDLMPNTFVVGCESEMSQICEDDSENSPESDPVDARSAGLKKWWNSIVGSTFDLRLAAAAVIVELMRAAVYEKTGFRCSAGISHNKMLAKLACGLHKPNKQTILPKESVPQLFKTIPVQKVRSLGGKLGDEIKEKFSIDTMSQLAEISLCDLQKVFGSKTGSYLHEVSHGLEHDPVTSRQLAKSIGCGKNFPGKTALSSESQIRYWLGQLSEELQERLEKDKQNNRRRATLLTVSFRRQSDSGMGAISRSCPLYIYDSVKISRDAYDLIHKSDSQIQNITNLSMSAGKFQDSVETIKNFFVNKPKGTTQIEDQMHLAVSSGLESSGTAEPENCSSKQNQANASKERPNKNNMPSFFAKRLQDKKASFLTSHKNDDKHSSDGFSVLKEKNGVSGIDEVGIEEEMESGAKDSNLENGIVTCSKNDSGLIVKPDFNMCFPRMESLETSILSDENDISSYKCDKCNESIPFEEIEEHSDFHFAQELQAQIRNEDKNNGTARKPMATQASSASGSGGACTRGKRKGRPKKGAPVATQKMRKLDSYFAQ